MTTITGGKRIINNNVPTDGIIRCCGQCPFAVNDCSNPNDTTNIWNCTNNAYKGPQLFVFKGMRKGNYMPGCPIKTLMDKKLDNLKKT
jgi:hypothetical protein